MALFLSKFVNKVDRKGRVSVPATFRNALAGQTFQGIVAFPSFKHAALQCGGMDWMLRLSESVGDFDLFSDEHDEMTATLFANAQQLAFDGDGRVVLPADLMEHANITAKVAFVGRGSLFEIWEPDAFTAYQAGAMKSMAQKGLTLKPGNPGAAT